MPHPALPRSARSLAVLALGAGLLAGCGGHKDNTADVDHAQVSFAGLGDANGAQTVAVNVPGFSAKLNVPALDLGIKDMSIDGIAFHPGTRLSGMTVSGNAGDGSGGEQHGTVEMGFVDPAAPDQVVAYYKQAAHSGGWVEVPPAAGQQFAATKARADGTEHLAMQVGAQGTGSAGKFLVTGG